MFPMPHGVLICQTENSDSCNQSEMAFKPAVYWKNKALPNSCLLPGSSFSLPFWLFSTSAKASSLTFMSEFLEKEQGKKKKKCCSINSTLLFHPFVGRCLPYVWKNCGKAHTSSPLMAGMEEGIYPRTFSSSPCAFWSICSGVLA